jgi:D-3-phosphoglycerate dehydrogenase
MKEEWEMNEEIRVLVCDPIHNEGVEVLNKAGFTVDLETGISPEELLEKVPEYDVLVVRSRTKVTKQVISIGKRLKAIGRAGVGLDNIDLDYAREKIVGVFNSPEAPSEAVAELAIGLMISLARSIPLADRELKDGNWIKKELLGWQLEGKNLGLLGFGRIGRRIARLARAFGMNVLITDIITPDPKLLEELEAKHIPMEGLLEKSDVISIHVPLTPKTRHMISKKEMEMMKRGAYLINTSRGSIIDETALLEAMRKGRIGGAALDVFEVEPPPNIELIKMPNLICTPHIGAQTKEGQKLAAVIVAEKIVDYLQDLGQE